MIWGFVSVSVQMPLIHKCRRMPEHYLTKSIDCHRGATLRRRFDSMIKNSEGENEFLQIMSLPQCPFTLVVSLIKVESFYAVNCSVGCSDLSDVFFFFFFFSNLI